MTTTVDLRAQTGTIKDQGCRGTCVACAATAAHELIRADGMELSSEFLHWASKRRDGLPPMSEGTTLPAAKDALREDGQPPEATWPYDDSRDQWAISYQPPGFATVEAKNHRLTGGEMMVPSAAMVRDALDGGRPVVLGVRLHGTWFGPGSDGRVAMPNTGGPDLGGHAVLVVGYVGDEFVVQNSWGIDWGDNGFGLLSARYIDSFGVAAWSLAR